jgi:iron(III) transport system substrate-binding protein
MSVKNPDRLPRAKMPAAKLLALALTFFASQALAQSSAAPADWEKQWNQLIVDAKKEGKVVIIAPPDPQVRQALPAAFTKRFGITVDYLGGRSNESSVKLRAERDAGANTVDVALSGIQTMATVFYREKMLEPLAPVLILPEVVDGSKWKKGKLWFMDPEQKYILRLFNTLGTLFYINTKGVNPEEIKTSRDLLDPKWKGKIIIHDPTVPGAGSNDAARLYVQFGEDFIKKLYVDQKPMIARDRRQVTDAVIHGTYPIAFSASSDELARLVKEGLPLKGIDSLPDLPGSLSAGVGEVGLLKSAPHPNAAKLFVNWIASKEGLEVFSRARGDAVTRNDIDESSYLLPEIVPHPGQEYFDTYDWEFTVTTKEKVRLRMKELLRAQ